MSIRTKIVALPASIALRVALLTGLGMVRLSQNDGEKRPAGPKVA